MLTLSPEIIRISDDNTFTGSPLTTLVYCGVRDLNYAFPESTTTVYVSKNYIKPTFAGISITKGSDFCPIQKSVACTKSRILNFRNIFFYLMVFVSNSLMNT